MESLIGGLRRLNFGPGSKSYQKISAPGKGQGEAGGRPAWHSYPSKATLSSWA